MIYAAVVAIPLFMKRDLRFGFLLTLAFVAQIYINGASATWWGGSAFGARRFASCALLFALGLGALITWLRAKSSSPLQRSSRRSLPSTSFWLLASGAAGCHRETGSRSTG